MSVRVRMVVDVYVDDEDELRKYATARMSECWGTNFALGTTELPRMVYEALIGSNENPSPDEYGISIGDSEVYEVPDGDTSYVRGPCPGCGGDPSFHALNCPELRR